MSAQIKASVRLVSGMQFVASGDSGHAILMDGLPKFGGTDSAPRPMELLLFGLGGCTGMDAISILRKKRQQVDSLEINLTGTKAEKEPMRYVDVQIEFVITGKGIDEDAVKRAISLSMEKYCSVKATLEQETKIGFTHRIIES